MISVLSLLILVFNAPATLQDQSPKIQAPSIDQVSQAAQQALNENRDDDAVTLFRQALKLKPDWDEGLWDLSSLFYEKEHFSEARDLLRHFLVQNPKHGPGWALLGLSEYKTHEWGRALQHLQRGLSLDMQNRTELTNAAAYHQAVLLARFEQYHDSLLVLYKLREAGAPQDSLEEAAGLAALGYPLLPEEVPPQRRALVRMAGVGTFARFDQRLADAEPVFRKMAEEFPQEPGVHYQYGLLLLSDRPVDGIQEIQKELALSPSHVPSRLRLAEYYLAQSQPEKARPYIDAVLKLEPNNASGHLLLGEELTKTGDNDGAIRELQTARELAPQRAKVLWALLRAYRAAGRHADADGIRAEIEKLREPDASE
ncbi:MAG: tetratricopeptide repeat protein [Candidatus Acidiferrum sp.]